MSDNEQRKFNMYQLRDKVRASREDDLSQADKLYQNNFSWNAISEAARAQSGSNLQSIRAGTGKNFHGQVLYAEKMSGQNLKNADFSGADLRESDLKNACLEGADFSGADLSYADLSGANLNHAVFSGATLKGTNFTGAKMHGVKLVDADIEDAILLDIDIDEVALLELQELIEFLAEYYPHKLNLRRINLTLLDLSRIDLRQVDLRGVDFTGCSFAGVNILELDLSECIISQAQIEQALGRPVTPKELKEILAPKKKKKKLQGIDLTDFFHPVGPVGVWDVTKHPGIRISDLMRRGKKLYDFFLGRRDTDQEILYKYNHRKEKTAEQREEERRTRMKEKMEEKKYEIQKEKDAKELEKIKINIRKEAYKQMQKKKLNDEAKRLKKARDQLSYASGREGR